MSSFKPFSLPPATLKKEPISNITEQPSPLDTQSNNTDLCYVCFKTPKKYKCSNCLAPYCSVACYKTHKTANCSKTVVVDAAKNNDNNLKVAEPVPLSFDEATLNRVRDGFEEEDWIKDEKLKVLLTNQTFLDKLKDASVQKVIKDLLDPTRHKLQPHQKRQIAKTQTNQVKELIDNLFCSVDKVDTKAASHPLKEVLPELLKLID